jgi:hypothetical protein
VSKTKKQGPCVFCGHAATTRDHIPPRGLFGKPTPHELIKVPACQKCNGGSSKDDEYLKRLALERGTESSRDSREVGEAVMRSFQKREAEGLRKEFSTSLRSVEVYTPSGLLYLGSGFMMKLDGERMRTILRKIVKGLFWHVSGKQRLPEGYEVAVYTFGEPPPDPVFIQNEREIMGFPPRVMGDRVFTFRHVISPADRNISLWWLQFYANRAFMGYTAKPTGKKTKVLTIADDPSEPTPPSSS